MKTYFVRHTQKLDIDAATRGALWDQRRVGIHFPDGKIEWPETDSTSLDPEDYTSSGRTALRRLLELSRNGGYVYAEYFGHDESLVGFIEPQSRIDLFKGTWGSRNNRSGRAAVMKTLLLTRTKTVKPSQYAVISVGRPRQGTIMKWPSAGKVIADIVEGRAGERSLMDLSADQQEILCSEFLRTGDAVALGLPKLARLVLPVGRTMRDIDIAALAEDGSRIYVQVTYGSREHSQHKIVKLKRYIGERCHLILFCQCEKPARRDSIYEIPLTLAYECFRSGPLGEAWLQMARGLA